MTQEVSARIAQIVLPGLDDDPTPLDTAIADFIFASPIAHAFSGRTRLEYATDLVQLRQFLADSCHVTRPEQLRRNQLEAFLAHLAARGLAWPTRRRKVAAIRTFCGWLAAAGRLGVSPAARLIPPRRQSQIPRVLSDAECARLLRVVQADTRDAAVVTLLLHTGMRLSELVRLTLTDVTMPASSEDGSGSVQISGRARARAARWRATWERSVPLSPAACQALGAYRAVRPAVPVPQLFLTKFQQPLGPRAVELLVTKYLTRAHMPHATVHSLRHTYAVRRLRDGASVDTVQQELGHASPATVARYRRLQQGATSGACGVAPSWYNEF